MVNNSYKTSIENNITRNFGYYFLHFSLRRYRNVYLKHVYFKWEKSVFKTSDTANVRYRDFKFFSYRTVNNKYKL